MDNKFIFDVTTGVHKTELYSASKEELAELERLKAEHPEWFLPPPPSAEERLAALEEAMIAMMGGNI